ncbi:hypothetical protein WDV93_01455 [Pantoea ananatis]
MAVQEPDTLVLNGDHLTLDLTDLGLKWKLEVPRSRPERHERCEAGSQRGAEYH